MGRIEVSCQKDSTGGPNPNTLARYNLGMKTLGTLLRAADEGLITLQDAAQTINMSVARFEEVVGYCLSSTHPLEEYGKQ